MNVKLISWPSAPADELAGRAAAVCYNGKNVQKSLASALAGGHESVLEHACFSFEVDGVSRVLLAQLTRHRLASFSVQSQRYCGINQKFVTPATIAESGWQDNYNTIIRNCVALYELMIDNGVPEEDARFIIPQAVTCRLIVTMNARELRHFFRLRTCNRAQWEIRTLADEMLRLCKEAAPACFADAGCACMAGKPCPEGKRSCGKPRKQEG